MLKFSVFDFFMYGYFVPKKSGRKRKAIKMIKLTTPIYSISIHQQSYPHPWGKFTVSRILFTFLLFIFEMSITDLSALGISEVF